MDNPTTDIKNEAVEHVEAQADSKSKPAAKAESKSAPAKTADKKADEKKPQEKKPQEKKAESQLSNSATTSNPVEERKVEEIKPEVEEAAATSKITPTYPYDVVLRGPIRTFRGPHVDLMSKPFGGKLTVVNATGDGTFYQVRFVRAGVGPVLAYVLCKEAQRWSS